MLQIDKLHFQIGNTKILKGISIDFQEGKVHGILGKNGAGKTSLFRSLYGFYKPTKGSISYFGQKINKEKMAFLETENYLYPYMRGREYLKLLKNDDALIDQWNAIFDLPLEQFSQEYSTGMKKKLAFIGVLLQDREILLLDEPFNGVDLESNEKIISIIQKLKGEKTILISSHILSTLSEISDQINVLEKGQFTQRIVKEDFESFEEQLKKDIQINIDELLNP